MTELRPYFGRGDLTPSNVLFWVTLFRRIFEQRFRCIIMNHLSTANTGVFPLISLMHVFIQMTVGDVLGEQGYVEAIF